MDGWIKLNRDLLQSKYFANPNDLKIWLWLMLKASTLDRYVTLKTGKGCRTIELKRGQLIFGRNKAEQEIKIDGSTIYRTLQRFQEEQAIKIEANNQYSVITVFDFINSQSFIESEDFEILESEQPINENSNNQRTTNEQPKNNQRASNDQPTNTVIEGLESKENLEFKEGLESNGNAGNLFGENELPKKPKKKKEKTEPAPKKEKVYTEFIKIYFDWFKDRSGVPPRMDAASGSTAKNLIAYFKEIVKGQAKEVLTEEQTEEKILIAWKYFLSSWGKLDAFSQNKTRLLDINANIQNLITQIKNNATGKDQSRTNGAQNGRFTDNTTAGERFASINQKFGDWDKGTN